MKINGLQSGRNPVRLIGINAPFQPALQFGREYSANNDPRLNSNQSWSNSGIEGRNAQTNSIKEPLPARQQSALAHQLSPQMQSVLRGGIRPMQNSGRGGSPKPQPFELHSIHAGQAIGNAEKRASTVAVAANISGQLGLRRVSGDI